MDTDVYGPDMRVPESYLARHRWSVASRVLTAFAIAAAASTVAVLASPFRAAAGFVLVGAFALAISAALAKVRSARTLRYSNEGEFSDFDRRDLERALDRKLAESGFQYELNWTTLPYGFGPALTISPAAIGPSIVVASLEPATFWIIPPEGWVLVGEGTDEVTQDAQWAATVVAHLAMYGAVRRSNGLERLFGFGALEVRRDGAQYADLVRKRPGLFLAGWSTDGKRDTQRER